MESTEHSARTASARKRFRRDPLSNPRPLINRVYAYAAYRIGAGDEAEDVTSEVFERAVRYRSSYDPAAGDPAAWLVGIARHVIADRGRRPQTVSADDALLATPEPWDMEGQTVLRITLDQAIALLPERDQELISLRFGADLKARQIAEILEIDTHAAEVALGRAVARLREQVGHDL
jgi:RNA polymerase sigma factor (sigma-70 family)